MAKAQFKIQLHTGRYVDLANIRDSFGHVDLQTIAWPLANINRFTGHTKRQWSVAQHCLLGALLLRQVGKSDIVVRGFLLHDKTEAFLNDLAAPIKRPMADYRNYERFVEVRLEQNFPEVYSQMTEEDRMFIKVADYDMLRLERLRFFSFNSGGDDRPETEEDLEAWGFSMEESRKLTAAYPFLLPAMTKLLVMHPQQVTELFIMTYLNPERLSVLL